MSPSPRTSFRFWHPMSMPAAIFRGALDARAHEINEPMKLAAAHALADVISQDELSPDYIIPSVFNRRVGKEVASAVARAAHESHVAHRMPKGIQL